MLTAAQQVSPEQVARLVTRHDDITPSLPLIVARQRQGTPIRGFTVDEVRAGITALLGSCQRALQDLT
jgi:hypothetical protein